MTVRTIALVSDNSLQAYAVNTTTFTSFLGGSLTNLTAETASTSNLRCYASNKSWTIRKFAANSTTNANTGDSTVRPYINSATANEVITFGSGVTGWVEDTTNTDTGWSGASTPITNRIITANSGGSLTLSMIRSHIDSSDYAPAMGHAPITIGNGVTGYRAYTEGVTNITTESQIQVTFRTATTLSYLQAIVASTATGTKTFRVRKNAANGSQVCTLGSNVTGLTSDTTNTDSFSAGDDLAYITSGQTQATAYGQIGCASQAAYGRLVNYCTESAQSTDTFAAIANAHGVTATEANAQCKTGYATEFKNLFTNISANTNATNDAAIRFRVNGANQFSIVLSANQTGLIENTSDSFTSDSDDLVNYQYDEVTASGGGPTLRLIGIEHAVSTAVTESAAKSTATAAALDPFVVVDDTHVLGYSAVGDGVVTPSRTPTSNALMLYSIVVVVNTGSTLATPTVSGASATWTLEKASAKLTNVLGAIDIQLFVFRALDATPDASDVVPDLSGSSGPSAYAHLSEYPGVTTGTPIVQSVANSGNSSSPSVTLAAFADAGNDAVGIFMALSALEAGSGFTLEQAFHPDAGKVIYAEWKGSSDTSVDSTTAASAEWLGIALELNFVSGSPVTETMALATADATSLALLTGLGLLQEKATADATALDPTAKIDAAQGLATADALAFALLVGDTEHLDLALATATALDPTAAIVALQGLATADALSLPLLTGLGLLQDVALADAISLPLTDQEEQQTEHLAVATADAVSLAITAALVAVMEKGTADATAPAAVAAIVAALEKALADATALALGSPGIGAAMGIVTADALALSALGSIVAVLDPALATALSLEVEANQNDVIALMELATATADALAITAALTAAMNLSQASASALAAVAALNALMGKSSADALALPLSADVKTLALMQTATASAQSLALVAAIVASLGSSQASALSLPLSAALVALLQQATADAQSLSLSPSIGTLLGVATASGIALPSTAAIVALFDPALATALALALNVDTFQGQLIAASLVGSGFLIAEAGLIIVYHPGQGEEWDNACVSPSDLINYRRVPQPLKYLPHPPASRI